MKNIAFAFPMQYRSIAFATALALLAWSLGLPMWLHKASADNVTYFSDTMSDSDLGLNSEHLLEFTTANAMNAGESFRIYFDEATQRFDFTGVTDADLISVNSSGFTPVNACGAGADEIDLTVNTTNDYIEGTICPGDTVPAGVIVFAIDGANLINNPGIGFDGSYVISLQGNGATPISDVGDTRVAIIDDVTVTASVDTIFTFSINGVGVDQTVNDDLVLTTGTSTATTVPFGTIAPGVAKLMAQELQVSTNALNGFSVTVFADQTLRAGNGATINPFIDGPDAGGIASSSIWQGPAETLGLTDTYGHWGLTSDDNVVSSTTPGLWGIGESAYVGNFINNPVEVFYHNTAVTYTQGGMGVGSTTVAYKVEISNLQEAAKDYTATLTYIATPVF
jgi:hypothetical protein